MQVTFPSLKRLFWSSWKSCWIMVTICMLTTFTVHSVWANTFSRGKLCLHALFGQEGVLLKFFSHCMSQPKPMPSQGTLTHCVLRCVTKSRQAKRQSICSIDTSATAEDTTLSRKLKGNREETVQKPSLVLRYNSNMGGVDLLDASLHHYDVNRKSYTWHVKYGLHLIHIMHRNSWIVYRHSGGTFTYLDFTIATILHWISQGGVGRQSVQGGRPRSTITTDTIERNPQPAHYPSKIPPREGNPRPSKRCRVCYSERNVRKQTVYQCVACAGEPGLCATPCFEIFHQK